MHIHKPTIVYMHYHHHHLPPEITFTLADSNKLENKLRGLSPQTRTIPTERPPLVGEVSANYSG
jgi:hypothetical protein